MEIEPNDQRVSEPSLCPPCVHLPEMLNRNLLNTHFKFIPMSNLKQFLITKTGVNKPQYLLAEILTSLKMIIKSESLFDPRNPSVILCSPQLEKALNMKALHVTEIRDLVLAQVQEVPDLHNKEPSKQDEHDDDNENSEEDEFDDTETSSEDETRSDYSDITENIMTSVSILTVSTMKLLITAKSPRLVKMCLEPDLMMSIYLTLQSLNQPLSP